MKWEDLSQLARDSMKELGNFGPTVNVAERLVKGAMYDPDCDGAVKTYYSSDDLRQIAAACNEVADWLDKRSTDEKPNAAMSGRPGNGTEA